MEFRNRRRSKEILPKLKRFSTAGSISSSAGSSHPHFDVSPKPPVTYDYLGFLRFDPINLRSTARRKKSMLDAVASAQSKTVHGKSSNHTDDYFLGRSDLIANISHFDMNICFIPYRFHYTAEELEPYREVGDPEMDDLLNFIAINKDDTDCGAFDDIIAYSEVAYHIWCEEGKQKEHINPRINFYAHYHDGIPNWVDFEQIGRGINVFLAYFPAAGCALIYRSLIGGFSIPKIIQVLKSTRYLTPGKSKDAFSISRDRKRTMERLLDTTGFLASCFAPADDTLSSASLRPGGRGWNAALRVRVLHGKVRRSLLQTANTKNEPGQSTQWDINEFGVPINQEDMAATLLAFSANTLMGIETLAGMPLSDDEQRDYLALWRYLGWLLGVDTVEEDVLNCDDINARVKSSNASSSVNPLLPIDPCGPKKLLYINPSTPVDDDAIIHSYATLESMILHLLHPNGDSSELALHLLNVMRDRFVSKKSLSASDFSLRKDIGTSSLSEPFSLLYRSEVCRKLLGDHLADKLGIPTSTCRRCSSIRKFGFHLGLMFTVNLFLFILRCYTIIPMIFPLFRKLCIRWHGRLLLKILTGWQKSHTKRVNDAQLQSSIEKSSHCPFSMLMTPKLDD